ncbi:hypothetical protein HDV63DRAFT_109517 [Trichoderma sp. SZMC 28014]
MSFSAHVVLWFMHVEVVTSALHDAKKQGLVMHVLCGGERAYCVTRGSLVTFGVLQRDKTALEEDGFVLYENMYMMPGYALLTTCNSAYS